MTKNIRVRLGVLQPRKENFEKKIMFWIWLVLHMAAVVAGGGVNANVGKFAEPSVPLFAALGVTGRTGSIGPIGKTGPTGATGMSGVDGSQGATGISGLGQTGPTGPQGLQGPSVGNTGQTGINGLIGPTGLQGATGASGISGASGVTGVTGTTGLSGLAGSTGAVGATGGVQSCAPLVAVSEMSHLQGGVTIPANGNFVFDTQVTPVVPFAIFTSPGWTVTPGKYRISVVVQFVKPQPPGILTSTVNFALFDAARNLAVLIPMEYLYDLSVSSDNETVFLRLDSYLELAVETTLIVKNLAPLGVVIPFVLSGSIGTFAVQCIDSLVTSEEISPAVPVNSLPLFNFYTQVSPQSDFAIFTKNFVSTGGTRSGWSVTPGAYLFTIVFDLRYLVDGSGPTILTLASRILNSNFPISGAPILNIPTGVPILFPDTDLYIWYEYYFVITATTNVVGYYPLSVGFTLGLKEGLVGYFNIQSVGGTTLLVNAGTLGTNGGSLLLPGATVPFDSQLSPDTSFAVWTGTTYQILTNGNYRVRASIQIQVNPGPQAEGSFVIVNTIGNIPIGPASPLAVAASNTTAYYSNTVSYDNYITVSNAPITIAWINSPTSPTYTIAIAFNTSVLLGSFTIQKIT